MNKKKFKIVISVLLVLLIISFMVTLCWGTYKVSPGEVINTLLGNGSKVRSHLRNSVKVSMLHPVR